MLSRKSIVASSTETPSKSRDIDENVALSLDDATLLFERLLSTVAPATPHKVFLFVCLCSTDSKLYIRFERIVCYMLLRECCASMDCDCCELSMSVVVNNVKTPNNNFRRRARLKTPLKFRTTIKVMKLCLYASLNRCIKVSCNSKIDLSL